MIKVRNAEKLVEGLFLSLIGEFFKFLGDTKFYIALT
jgi:hypothetical protein